MPRTKGNKNRPKTNIIKDYASQIVEKQETIASLNTEIASIRSIESEASEREEAALKKPKKKWHLEAKKAKADAKAAEEAKKPKRGCAEEAAGQRHECGRDPRKTEIKIGRVDKLNSRSSHGIF